MQNDFYRFMDLDAPALALILSSFGLSLPAKLYRRAELKGLKKKLEIFI